MMYVPNSQFMFEMMSLCYLAGCTSPEDMSAVRSPKWLNFVPDIFSEFIFHKVVVNKHSLFKAIFHNEHPSFLPPWTFASFTILLQSFICCANTFHSPYTLFSILQPSLHWSPFLSNSYNVCSLTIIHPDLFPCDFHLFPRMKRS